MHSGSHKFSYLLEEEFGQYPKGSIDASFSDLNFYATLVPAARWGRMKTRLIIAVSQVRDTERVRLNDAIAFAKNAPFGWLVRFSGRDDGWSVASDHSDAVAELWSEDVGTMTEVKTQWRRMRTCGKAQTTALIRIILNTCSCILTSNFLKTNRVVHKSADKHSVSRRSLYSASFYP